MTHYRPVSWKAAAFLFLALACARNAPPKEGVPIPKLSLLGTRPLVVPFRDDVDGFRVGGLSGIVPAPDGTWLAVVDNERETPARVLRLAFTVGENGATAGVAGRPVAREAIRLEGFNGKNLDGEGIALLPSGNLLVSSETEPSIREFSPVGKLMGELPVPPLFQAGKGTGIRGNQGFESLTLAPDGRTLWTANERALQQDAPDEKERPSPVRLLRFDRREGAFVPGTQLVYQVEPIENPGTGFSVRGLAELLALPAGGLLALEREYVEGRGMRIQLYFVSTAGAADVSGLESLAGRSYTPVQKTLVYDFARAGFQPDNLEGLAFGPRLADGSRTLVLISDDNFVFLQQTQIVALRWVE
jgi:3-phytase